ncbi:MAG: 50S ribosomal protein L11 methyltransferase [Bacteroidales bacterium]|nr:50S ribosomal protein L11 methyltransferase [Bacteroidales bacterium]
MSGTTLCDRLRKTLPRARTAVTRPAGCPDVALNLFDHSVLEGPLSHDEAQAVQAEPAYWSFCWASGQVLARYLLDNPGLVAGRRVIDVGCGSGVVAIAAALAGAREVVACDLDADALAATAANAALNGVAVSLCADWQRRPGFFDMVTAADVLYDRDNLTLVEDFARAAPSVLLADSRVRDFAHPAYQLLATGEARTWPDLHEFEEFNEVRIFAAGAAEWKT